MTNTEPNTSQCHSSCLSLRDKGPPLSLPWGASKGATATRWSPLSLGRCWNVWSMCSTRPALGRRSRLPGQTGLVSGDIHCEVYGEQGPPSLRISFLICKMGTVILCQGTVKTGNMSHQGGLPGRSSGLDSTLPMQEAQVRSLVRELDSTGHN